VAAHWRRRYGTKKGNQTLKNQQPDCPNLWK
jgi:hypothetical protein